MKKDNQDRCNSFQEHVHEFLFSAMPGFPPENPELSHNHRVAGVTGSVIPTPDGGHVHIICVNTDFFFNHFHQVEVKTGPAIPVKDKDGNIIGHVHAITGTTSCTFFHTHDFKGNTLIQNPQVPIQSPCYNCKKDYDRRNEDDWSVE